MVAVHYSFKSIHSTTSVRLAGTRGFEIWAVFGRYRIEKLSFCFRLYFLFKICFFSLIFILTPPFCRERPRSLYGKRLLEPYKRSSSATCAQTADTNTARHDAQSMTHMTWRTSNIKETHWSAFIYVCVLTKSREYRKVYLKTRSNS